MSRAETQDRYEKHGVDVAIDRSLCIGSGPCFVIAARTFALDSAMKAMILDPEAETESALLEAARTCPTQAIYLSRSGRPIYP
ncbi:MAG TPA: ferredoxin [Chloroflexota bacterium]